MSTLELLGLGVVLASLGLPLLWLTARGEDTEPASRHHRLVLVLGCANALLLAPLAWSLVPGLGGAPAQRLQALAGAAPEGLRAQAAPVGALGWLALGWLVVCGVGLLRTGWDALRLRRALAQATPAAEEDCIRALQLARGMGLPTPRLLESPLISVPCAASSWRPAILLPTGLRARLSDAAFDCVLRHELAHLGRADQVWAFAVAVLRIPFVLHPVTPRVVAGVSLAREEAVDALVARADAHTYASALLEVAAQARTGPGFPEAVFMGAHALSRRVHMLTQPRVLRRASWFPLLAAALCLGGLAMVASPAIAAEAVEGGLLSMGVGDQKVITVPKLTRVAVGDAAVVDVNTLGNEQLHLKALKPGSTTLLVWTPTGQLKYRITVR